jgi:hypothetical protein
VDLVVRVPWWESFLVEHWKSSFGGALEELLGGVLEGFLWWSIGDGFL